MDVPNKTGDGNAPGREWGGTGPAAEGACSPLVYDEFARRSRRSRGLARTPAGEHAPGDVSLVNEAYNQAGWRPTRRGPPDGTNRGPLSSARRATGDGAIFWLSRGATEGRARKAGRRAQSGWNADGYRRRGAEH